MVRLRVLAQPPVHTAANFRSQPWTDVWCSCVRCWEARLLVQLLSKLDKHSWACKKTCNTKSSQGFVLFICCVLTRENILHCKGFCSILWLKSNMGSSIAEIHALRWIGVHIYVFVICFYACAYTVSCMYCKCVCVFVLTHWWCVVVCPQWNWLTRQEQAERERQLHAQQHLSWSISEISDNYVSTLCWHTTHNTFTSLYTSLH